MKKLLLYIFLATFFSNVSFADWLFGSKTKNDTWYYEGSSIVKEGDIMYVWILTDYNSIGKYNEMSVKSYVPIKCKLKHFQIVTITYYSKNMGKGSFLERIENPDIKWIPAPPGSAWAGIIKRVCGK
tara:strand:- start:178 stop:558 length:381 start_codon:yes stop_codon:yes gene_type:complete